MKAAENEKETIQHQVDHVKSTKDKKSSTFEEKKLAEAVETKDKAAVPGPETKGPTAAKDAAQEDEGEDSSNLELGLGSLTQRLKSLKV